MTDYMPKNTISDIIRLIFGFIDRAVYSLMEFLYSIFFTVATADILGGEMIKSIYYRVQLILGVFMIFKLAVTILQGIMNPDLVYDKKQGLGKIVSRIVVSLIMIALITPINVPNPSNEWEKQLSNNGLLFGSLFSLQNRILSNNTIGRIILGTTDTATEATSPNNLLDASRTFSTTILKIFVRINVLPELQEDPGDGRDPATIKANRVCKNFNNNILKTYTRSDARPNEILSLINLGCGRAENGTNAATLFNEEVQEVLGNEYYAFYYMPIISTIVGIIIDFVLIAYSIDVAIRVFKLAILRLIAPIPIISHMNIDASKEAKGADSFSLWTKALISTYLEIFIRLAVIYFVLFVIQGLMAKGINGLFLGLKFSSAWYINALAFVFVIIGLMLFAKQAPKYIQSVLGIQSTGGSVGLTAFATIAGNLQGGNNIFTAKQPGLAGIKERYDNFQKTVGGTVAERNFGDKTKGVGLMESTRDAAVKKQEEKYGQKLQQEYYKRGLDLQESSNYHKKWWENKDYKEIRDKVSALEQNQQHYKAQLNNYQRASGLGNAVRVAQTPVPPPTQQQTQQQQTQQPPQNPNPPTGPTP